MTEVRYGEGEGVVRTLREPRGFWLPNEIIDQHFGTIKARGLALYCLIARQITLYQYPGVVDLACTLRVTERRVEEILDVLASVGLLNERDLRAIRGVI